jgi:hypothetical protein
MTVHDFDLYHELSLLVKIQKISEFRLIAVPAGAITPELIDDVIDFLTP